MSMILDIIVVVVFAVIVCSSYRKGLARSIIELAGYIASYVAANILSAPLGNWIFTSFLHPVISGQIKNEIEKNLASSAASKADGAINSSGVTNLLNNIPNVYKNLLGSSNISTADLHNITNNAIKSGSQSATNTLITTIIDPITKTISIGIAFIIIFALCIIVVRIIARLSSGVSKVPIIGTFNKIGGAGIGVIKSVFVLFIIATLIAVLVPVFSLQNNHMITQADINDTSIFKIIYYNNPFTQILLKK